MRCRTTRILEENFSGDGLGASDVDGSDFLPDLDFGDSDKEDMDQED